MSRSNAATTVFVKILASAVLCAGLLVVLVGCQRDADATGDTVVYETNENGLTYGSLVDVDRTETGESPDLVAALATNGNEGYFYYSEYQAIVEQDTTLSPEEIEARTPQREATIAAAFKEAAADYYGYDLLAQSDLVEALRLTTNSNGSEQAQTVLGEKVRLAVLSNKAADGTEIVPNGDASAASQAVMANMKEAIQEGTQLAQVNPSAAPEIAARDMATIDEASFMTSVEYWYFYNKAKQSVGVKLPVYKSDGITVVGEVIVDSL